MTDPVVRIHGAASEIDAAAWDSLLAAQAAPSPFMRHAYLDAMEQSDSASPQSGWAPRFLTLWRGRELMAACPMYLKGHSYGEYIHLCTLLSIDQMNLGLEDGYNKRTGGRGAKHHVSPRCWRSEALARAAPARIARC